MTQYKSNKYRRSPSNEGKVHMGITFNRSPTIKKKLHYEAIDEL